MKRVYLAGPISGTTYEQCNSWRKQVSDELAPYGITCYSPTRHKEFLHSKGVIEQSYPEHVLSTDRAIVTRDHNDVIKADVILMNLLGCPSRVSIGTMFELAWAWDRHVPVVLAIEKEGNCHSHPFVRECAGFSCSTLEESINVARSILLP